MRPGRMDKQIQLFKKLTTDDAYGAEVVNWIPLCKVGTELKTGKTAIGTLYQITATQTNYFYTGVKVGDVWKATSAVTLSDNNKVKPVLRSYQEWSERRELKGDEKWAAQQTVANITCKYLIRYRDDVTPLEMLVDASSREYDIHSAIELGRKEGLELTVKGRGE